MQQVEHIAYKNSGSVSKDWKRSLEDQSGYRVVDQQKRKVILIVVIIAIAFTF